MSDDPLHLGGLDAESIAKAKEDKATTKKSKDPVAQKNAETAAKREERLANKNTSAAPPPQMVMEPEVDRSHLLDKIVAYRERFPNLKSRNKVSGKSSIDEIEDELHYIERQLGQKDGNMGHQMFYLALSGLEEGTKVYNPLNLNLTGLARVARDNQDEFNPILDELFIKYAVNMYVGPEMRLTMAVATLVYTVHAANSGNVQVARAMAEMSKPAPQDPSGL